MTENETSNQNQSNGDSRSPAEPKPFNGLDREELRARIRHLEGKIALSEREINRLSGYNEGLERQTQGQKKQIEGLTQQNQGLLRQNQGLIEQNQGLSKINQTLKHQNGGTDDNGAGPA
ncbi:MAG TPA: hypothetical protein VFV50_07035 [Bdellovibrionales bacterium]|nr:hypothetical protein [Bdellovibrionales bacterium]